MGRAGALAPTMRPLVTLAVAAAATAAMRLPQMPPPAAAMRLRPTRPPAEMMTQLAMRRRAARAATQPTIQAAATQAQTALTPRRQCRSEWVETLKQQCSDVDTWDPAQPF